MVIMAAAMLSHLPLAGQNGGEVPFNGIVETVAGDGVPRMTVMLKGSSKRTSTDRHGRFGLVNVPEDGVLVLSRRGEEWEIPLEGRRSLRVVMSDEGVVESEESEDLISLGFAFVKRREYNYSSDMITGEELRRSGQQDLVSALVGRVAGLMRANGELSIRGNVDARPLYLVDGVEVQSLDYININDVESVSLLKDGAAVAVYGLEAAGGVMIVTTKKGRQGAMNLTYKGSYGASFNTSYPEFLDGPGYAYWYNKALELDGQEPIFTAKHVQMMREGTNGWGNTNWIDEIFGTGTIQQHSVTSTGGSDRISYFASLGYMNQTGNVKNFDYDRYNLRTNIEAKIAKSLTFTFGVAGQIGDRTDATG